MTIKKEIYLDLISKKVSELREKHEKKFQCKEERKEAIEKSYKDLYEVITSSRTEGASQALNYVNNKKYGRTAFGMLKAIRMGFSFQEWLEMKKDHSGNTVLARLPKILNLV